MSQAAIDKLEARIKANPRNEKSHRKIIDDLKAHQKNAAEKRERQKAALAKAKKRVDEVLGKSTPAKSVGEMKAPEAKKHVASIEDYDELQEALASEEGRSDGGRASVLAAIEDAEEAFE
jgi:hypothetical protein